MLLDKNGIKYDTIIADENKELVYKFDIKQAPTLVVKTDLGFNKYKGVSEIKGYLMSLK